MPNPLIVAQLVIGSISILASIVYVFSHYNRAKNEYDGASWIVIVFGLGIALVSNGARELKIEMDEKKKKK